MKNVFLIILFIPLLINCQTEKSAVSKYPVHVGNIEPDEKSDDPNFKRCLDERYVFQYYNDSKGVQYKGEKATIQNEVQKLSLPEIKNSNGYITIRFIVNCEGKSGLFRMQQMNEEYKEYSFAKQTSDQLINFTKKLNGWIPKEIEGRKVDYYQYLTYKIENGKVSEILP